MSLPSPTHLASRLRTLVTTSPPRTALFYARIWHALLYTDDQARQHPHRPQHVDTHEPLHALALAFLADEQPYSALHLVRETAEADAAESDEAKGKWDGCGGEGQAVLERAVQRGANLDVPVLCPASSSSSAALLLAKLSHKGKSPAVAAEQYTRALSLDPWLWEAFTGLCDLGSAPSAETVFPDPPSISRAPSSRTSRPPTLSPNPSANPTLHPMPRSSASEMTAFQPRRQQMISMSHGPTSGGFFTPDLNAGGTARLGMLGNPSSWDTPSVAGDTTFPIISEHSELPSLPAANRRPFPNLMSALSSASSMLPSLRPATTPVTSAPDLAPKPPAMKRPRGHGSRLPVETPQSHNGGVSRGLEIRPGGREMKGIEPNGESDGVRRSTRLKAAPSKTVKVNRERDKRTTRSRSATSSASGATIEVPVSSPLSMDTQLQLSADDWLRDVVRRCARAYRALSMYRCQEALSEVDTLPVELQKSPWALDIVARSFYEMANYVLARRAFRALLTVEPYRLESTELYSTLLWHLSDPPALSHLSQSLMAVSRESPQAWIAAGNTFSLQRDHDEAMRCFRRAAQIDPGCAYAWTLCGYEAVEMEEWERALGSIVPRSERTYGMGLVYLKTGKPRYAEHHFRRAAEINPTNAVLLCCIGMVLEQTDDVVGALAAYEEACKYAPESPMVLFKRIRMLVALQRIDDAIAALEPLARTAPDEAQVHFLLGKCYLRNHRRGEATVCFTAARELQPKLEGAIRATIEANGEEEEGRRGVMQR
ncbi:anaphase-promoting complex subunit cdc27 [Saitozyma podzolica]|uniref:Anaphase-promoting complex subunit cdc27 n=1 Tax=Saitozyma podzolica TaxID=1890683 RepID=A0A427Y8G3_9TREE|nr:anaphase-promoting complex subunit cdc27 [Saitozyma podzolica]